MLPLNTKASITITTTNTSSNTENVYSTQITHSTTINETRITHIITNNPSVPKLEPKYELSSRDDIPECKNVKCPIFFKS